MKDKLEVLNLNMFKKMNIPQPSPNSSFVIKYKYLH
jgi:hypothetical protein